MIQDIRPARPGITLQGSTNVAPTDRIRFGADGMVRIGTTPDRDGAVSICSDDLPIAENTRDVRVNVSRVWVETRNGTAACTTFTD